jgi:biotin synthase
MPKSVVRLPAGRQYMTDELQALCFLAGANSIFIGDVLLTHQEPAARSRRKTLLSGSA